MKILNPQSALLTNNELYTHLTTKRSSAGSTSRKSKAPAYEAVTREILEYLSPGSTVIGNATATSSTSSGAAGSRTHKTAVDKTFPLPAYGKVYSDEKVGGLVRELAAFELVKAEVLGIVNLAPKDLPSLDALVEELDERFSHERQEEILQIIEKWLR